MLRIETLSQKKLVGNRQAMSFANNKTFELWQSFRQRQKEIKNTVSSDLYSMQIYPLSFNPEIFNPQMEFEKWAAIEVSDFSDVPDGFETYLLKGGLYAVFIHKGTPETFPRTWRYIFNEWLPQSGYELDNREHFEVLGEQYKRNDPESEEEVWIPIKTKAKVG